MECGESLRDSEVPPSCHPSKPQETRGGGVPRAGEEEAMFSGPPGQDL